MSFTSAGITHRVIQEAMPEFHIGQDLLDGVLTAIPSPPAEASVAWRHARLTRIIEEIAAFNPFDAVQARLASEIVMTQFLAEDTGKRSCAPDLTVEQVCRLRRTTTELMRTGERLERALERRQARAVPWRDAPATDGFDLGALDAVWRDDPARHAGEAAVPARTPRPGDSTEAQATPEPPDDSGMAALVSEERVASEPTGTRRAAGRGHAPARPTSLDDRPALVCDGVEPASGAGRRAAR
jgi:hypothetical protein